MMAEFAFIHHFFCMDAPDSVYRGELDFHLTTFTAAAEFLLSEEVARIVVENTCYDFLKPAILSREMAKSTVNAQDSDLHKPFIDLDAD
mmetsp:Transcript_16962/g.23435  ORF Transcript_16962/g.23435 Transcript_16962/m.23435 type:complete len:89 (+) Transcript_16962:232-498(+)